MQPLNNIRVLDLTHVLAGPFCTYQLAVLGADVIKIEAPSNPDMMRDDLEQVGVGADLSLRYCAQSAGKRAITLNLKTEQGRDIFKQLVATADVLMENYRCGVMDELGLGYESMAALNPRLIYCSLTGYGHTGPKAKHPAYDNVIQAFSGLMAATGSKDTEPVKVGPPVLDYGAGAQAALAITAALLQRHHSGHGQRIDVAMLDAALMLMSSFVTQTLAGGVPPTPTGNSNPHNAGYGCFQSADGMLMIGAYTVRQLTRLWRALGDEARASQIETMSLREVVKETDSDRKRIETIVATRAADEWEHLLNDAGVPAARVRNLHEALCHQQVASRNVVQHVPSPMSHGETLSVPVAAFSYAEHGPTVSTAPPRVGQHTHAILEELGFSRAQIAALRHRAVI